MNIRRVGFALAALLLLGGVAEGAAAFFGPKLLPPDRSPLAKPGQVTPQEPNMVGDAAAGWRPKVGRQMSFGIPGGTTVNSRAMRGPEVPLAATRPRLLVLGDSTIFGVMVADGDTIAARLALAFPGVEVLNGGVPGYSSWQALHAFDDRFAELKPDMLLVATLWSDTQGTEAPDATRLGGARAPLLENSRAFVFLREWVRQARWGKRAEKVGFGISPVVAPSLRVPLGEYAANLRALATRAPHVAYLVLPCVNDPAQGRVGDFRDAYREAMRETARDLGAPIIDAPPAFLGADAAKLFLDEVHPSAAGDAKIAALVAEALGPWAASAR